MHILLDYRPALRQRTGVGEYVHHLSDALLRRMPPADRVTLFSSSWKDRLSRDVLPTAARRDLHIPVQLLNLAWHRLQWPPVEALGFHPDVTWSFHPLLMPSRRAARVVTIYDLYFLDRPQDTTGEIRRDYAALAPGHARKADAVVVISEYTRDQVVRRLGVPPERVTVCYPGAPEWTARAQPSAPGPILHVGTVGPRKNVDALIRAYVGLLSATPDAPDLVFAGRVDVSPDISMVAHKVRFLGYVDDDTRQRLYREASMLVMASADEGFGMPAAEAMAVGVPVVAAARGALPEVIGEAGLLVDPDDPGALVAALTRVLRDDGLRQDLAARGRVRVRRFTWEAAAVRAHAALGAAVARRKERR